MNIFEKLKGLKEKKDTKSVKEEHHVPTKNDIRESKRNNLQVLGTQFGELNKQDEIEGRIRIVPIERTDKDGIVRIEEWVYLRINDKNDLHNEDKTEGVFTIVLGRKRDTRIVNGSKRNISERQVRDVIAKTIAFSKENRELFKESKEELSKNIDLVSDGERYFDIIGKLLPADKSIKLKRDFYISKPKGSTYNHLGRTVSIEQAYEQAFEQAIREGVATSDGTMILDKEKKKEIEKLVLKVIIEEYFAHDKEEEIGTIEELGKKYKRMINTINKTSKEEMEQHVVEMGDLILANLEQRSKNDKQAKLMWTVINKEKDEGKALAILETVMDVAKNEFYEQHKGIILAYEEEQKIKNVDVENNEEVRNSEEQR
ncbi:MAG: hypothetical protein HFJ53_04350 [Clostridia bacterium]|jgi:hypothetical protein|nr:hypothetical protein [Clostridia bacterium]